MNRTLPAWAIDMIRDGLPTATLGVNGGDKALWKALYQLSCSANQRGWDAMELRAEVEHPSSRLGHQILTKDGVRPRSEKQISSLFANTWDRAHEWLSTQGSAWSIEQAHEQIARRAKLVDQIAADADAPLVASDRAVLAFVADEMRRRNMAKIVLPWRPITEATGLGQRSVQNALARLVKAELLTLHSKGRPNQRSRVTGGVIAGKAAIYGVLPRGESHPYLCPVNGAYGTPGGPQPRPMGPPSAPEPGPPAKNLWDPPSDQTSTSSEVVDVTEAAKQFVSLDPGQLDALLDAIRNLHKPADSDVAPRPNLRLVDGRDR